MTKQNIRMFFGLPFYFVARLMGVVTVWMIMVSTLLLGRENTFILMPQLRAFEEQLKKNQNNA